MDWVKSLRTAFRFAPSLPVPSLEIRELNWRSGPALPNRMLRAHVALGQCLNLFPQPWRSALTVLIEISKGEHSRPLALL
jgi:hypothetical protein